MSHIRIAVTNVSSELTFNTDQSTKEIKASIEKSIKDGTTLSLTDVKGREFIVPAEKIGYIEIGEQTERRVGFGA